MGLAAATGRTALQTKISMADVEPFLQQVGQRIEDYSAKAQAIVVGSDAQAEQAGSFARDLAQTVESIERQRKEFVDPLNAHVKLINTRFKAISQPLMNLVNVVKDKLRAYQDKKELAARQAAEAERKRLEKLDEAKAARAEKAGKPIPPPRPAPVALPVAKNYGTTQARKLWTFKVLDIAAVPVEYLEVDGPKVRRAMADKKKEIEAGAQPIPGLEFYQETNIAV